MQQLFSLSAGLLNRFKPLMVIIFLTGICNASFAQQDAKMKTNDVAIANFKKANANKTEPQLKQAQAKIMKELCPNHPAYKPAVKQNGVSMESANAYNSWKKSYPAEYAAYLKIFDFKY